MNNMVKNASDLINNKVNGANLTIKIDNLMNVDKIDKGVDVEKLVSNINETLSDTVLKTVKDSLNKKFGW